MKLCSQAKLLGVLENPFGALDKREWMCDIEAKKYAADYCMWSEPRPEGFEVTTAADSNSLIGSHTGKELRYGCSAPLNGCRADLSVTGRTTASGWLIKTIRAGRTFDFAKAPDGMQTSLPPSFSQYRAVA